MHNRHRDFNVKTQDGKNHKMLVNMEDSSLELFRSVDTNYEHFSKTALQLIYAHNL